MRFAGTKALNPCAGWILRSTTNGFGPVWRHARHTPKSVGILFLWPGFAGCATVDSRPDFQNAGRLISERTGVKEVYDPSTDDTVEQKVAELLADGLTLDEAVNVALLNNRSFQALFLEIGVSRADVVQSGLVSNPSLSMIVQFPEGGGRSKLNVGFAQQLVDLWQIPVHRKIAEAQLEQTLLEAARRAVELGAEVKTKYHRVLARARGEAIAVENLSLVDESSKLAQARFDAGETSQLDLNLVRALSLDASLERLAAERDHRVARIELARALGLNRAQPHLVLMETTPNREMTNLDNERLLTFALTERLDARMAALATQAADDELKRQYLNLFPNVTLGVEAERPERRSLPGRNVLADTARASVANGGLTAPNIQSRAERDLERRQIIDSLIGPSLNITLPIWDQNQAQIAKARYKAAQRRKENEDLLDTIAQQVQEAVAVARSANEQVLFYRDQALPQAEANVDAARRAYQGGEQGILVLIEAQERLIRLRRSYVDAAAEYAIAFTELERAIGGRWPGVTVQLGSESEVNPQTGG